MSATSVKAIFTMLISTLKPLPFSDDSPYGPKLDKHTTLRHNSHGASCSSISTVPKLDPEFATKSERNHGGPSADAPDGDTVEVIIPLPVSTSFPSDRSNVETTEDDAHLSGWCYFPSNSVVDGRSGESYLGGYSPGFTGRRKKHESVGHEDPDQDADVEELTSESDSASVVSSVPYGGPEENLREGLTCDADTSHYQNVTPITASASTLMSVNRCESREPFDSVVDLMPSNTKTAATSRSSQSNVIAEANDTLAVAMTGRRRWSHSQVQHSAAALDTFKDVFAMRFLPPLTPTSLGLSSSTTQPARRTARKSLGDQNSYIKAEFSPLPTLSSSDLEAQIKTLDYQVRQKTSLFASHNTRLDTLSPRLNNLVSACGILAQTRKNLLDQRKTLGYRINANREELKDTKAKAQRLQEQQAEVMEARDKAQYGLDVLMEKKRDVVKALANKRFERALEANFPDKELESSPGRSVGVLFALLTPRTPT